MLIIEILKEQKNMSDVEKQIADYFLKKELSIKEISARQVSKELYLSPSTIVRFCQKYTNLGYNDFKEKYLSEIKYIHQNFSNINANLPFEKNDRNLVVAHKIGSLYKSTVDDTLSLNNHDNIQKAIRLLEKSNCIHLCSVGDSIALASIFRDRMLRLGKKVIVESRADNCFHEACFSTDSDCFILISYSGETEGILKIAKKLQERGMPFLVITSYGGNSLTRFSKSIPLHISTRENLIENLGNFSTDVSILFLLDTLYASYFAENYEINYLVRNKDAKEYQNKRSSNNPLIQS